MAIINGDVSAHVNEAFPNELVVSEWGYGYFRVEKEFIFRDEEKNLEVTVPVGFITNFYSVPWYVREFVPKVLNSNGPAVVHDYLYSRKLTDEERLQADHVLLRAMELHPVPVRHWRRMAIFNAVRSFGGFCTGEENIFTPWSNNLKPNEWPLHNIIPENEEAT